MATKLPPGYARGKTLYLDAWVGDGAIIPSNPDEVQSDCLNRFIAAAERGDEQAEQYLAAVKATDYWVKLLALKAQCWVNIIEPTWNKVDTCWFLVLHSRRTEAKYEQDLQTNVPLRLLHRIITVEKLAGHDLEVRHAKDP